MGTAGAYGTATTPGPWSTSVSTAGGQQPFIQKLEVENLDSERAATAGVGASNQVSSYIEYNPNFDLAYTQLTQLQCDDQYMWKLVDYSANALPAANPCDLPQNTNMWFCKGFSVAPDTQPDNNGNTAVTKTGWFIALMVLIVVAAIIITGVFVYKKRAASGDRSPRRSFGGSRPSSEQSSSSSRDGVTGGGAGGAAAGSGSAAQSYHRQVDEPPENASGDYVPPAVGDVAPAPATGPASAVV